METDTLVNELHKAQSLSILKFARPYLPSTEQQTYLESNSPDSRSQISPSILLADLTHYQELFSKLRFSYVEQVTKERFLRAITSEQPEFVSGGENTELEERLRTDKSQLKERKVEVRELIKDLEEQGRQLARRYQDLQLQTQQLANLPSEIEHLESTIVTLRNAQAPKSENPELALSLQQTQNLLSQRERQLSDLDRQIEALQNAIPRKQAEILELQDEVTSLNLRKTDAVEEAKEAQKRKQTGGMSDDLDERGRWLRSVESGLKMMLEV